MARALRLEFAGALDHVTARGNERRSIFLGDADSDRAAFLGIPGQTRTAQVYFLLSIPQCLDAPGPS